MRFFYCFPPIVSHANPYLVMKLITCHNWKTFHCFCPFFFWFSEKLSEVSFVNLHSRNCNSIEIVIVNTQERTLCVFKWFPPIVWTQNKLYFQIELVKLVKTYIPLLSWSIETSGCHFFVGLLIPVSYWKSNNTN